MMNQHIMNTSSRNLVATMNGVARRCCYTTTTLFTRPSQPPHHRFSSRPIPLLLPVRPTTPLSVTIASRRMMTTTHSSALAQQQQGRRLPTPPMPRTTYDVVITEVSHGSNTAGNTFFTIAIVISCTILLDLYLQNQELRDTRGVGGGGGNGLNKEEMIQQIVISAQQQRELLYQQYSTAPILYQCQVMQYYKMGGSHGLYNVQLQDIVDVLVEHVGPKQAYHLCRFIRPPNDKVDMDSNSSRSDEKTTMTIHTNDNGDIIELGWYPISHLQRYTPPPKPRSWWRRLLML